MALKARERLAAYGLALYMAVAGVAITMPNGLSSTERLWVGLAAAMAVAVAVGARFASRLVTVLSCVACSVWPGWQSNRGKNALLAYPFLALVLYLTFAMSKSRRDITERRISQGDLGDSASDRRSAKAVAERATVDALGRDLPGKSKRYTPPKQKKSGPSATKTTSSSAKDEPEKVSSANANAKAKAKAWIRS